MRLQRLYEIYSFLGQFRKVNFTWVSYRYKFTLTLLSNFHTELIKTFLLYLNTNIITLKTRCENILKRNVKLFPMVFYFRSLPLLFSIGGCCSASYFSCDVLDLIHLWILNVFQLWGGILLVLFGSFVALVTLEVQFVSNSRLTLLWVDACPFLKPNPTLSKPLFTPPKLLQFSSKYSPF